MNPFLKFRVLPNYGMGQAVIDWQITPGVLGDIYFYRSESGIPGSWTLLNEGAPITGTAGTFLDAAAVNDYFNFPHYRGLVDPGGGESLWLKGPDVTALEHYTRKDYFLAREILRREYQAMAGPYGNGIRVLHYIPRTSGTSAPLADAETGQVLGPDCPEATESGYGTPWLQGFFPPVQTWIRPISLSEQTRADRKDGTGTDDNFALTLRMLTFPKPDKGHLLVALESDRRYVLGPSIKPFYLRSTIPLFWEAQATLLDHDDPRHRVPLPDTLADS